jgi:hypothetical protein
MIITTNLAQVQAEGASNPFYEQVKAINTALNIFAKKHMGNIQNYLDRNEIQAADTYVYFNGQSIHLLVFDVSRRLLLTAQSGRNAMSLVFRNGQFEQIEIKADPAQYPDEEAKWALAHVALQLLFTLTNADMSTTNWQRRNNMKLEMYEVNDGNSPTIASQFSSSSDGDDYEDEDEEDDWDND